MTNARVLARLAPLALCAAAIGGGCVRSSTLEDAGQRDDAGRMDAGVGEDAAPPDAIATDAPGRRDVPAREDAGCCPSWCPPEYCVGSECVPPSDCCSTGECPSGLSCDWDSCGCVTATGCCAGEACPGTSFCDYYSCTCVSDDCCYRGYCEEPGTVCDSSCGCVADASCGPTCTGEHYCDYGECRHRCTIDGCADGLLCNRTDGCVVAACTNTECALRDPPLSCDPSVGCYDPCERAEDWTWCTDAGGMCALGVCIDPSCGAGATACRYRMDCCGNFNCLADTEPDPWCDPTYCETREPAPRPELCQCGLDGRGCADLWGGRGIFPPPPPPPMP